ncbi:MAG: hypothetical protein RLO51_08430 [Thalassobaculum sp.]|uniref:hypothetical protein n=1 Tax=Thalassobaculum sp. TaxID=2022740 RepID=UPI0032EB280F
MQRVFVARKRDVVARVGNAARWLGLAGVALTLAACAKSPSSIAPASVASSEYEHLGCHELNRVRTETEFKLADASSRQNDAQTADAIGVFLVLIPVSALTGDAEGEVAQYKGEKLAIERTISRKKC